MIDLSNITDIYFVGIGGIGMSALALYFSGEGYNTAGYDRSRTLITDTLEGAGCRISYDDDINNIPLQFKDIKNRSGIIIVYTPAITYENNILSYFRDNSYRIYKRSEVLGELSSKTDTIAIAGTHGKTTVST
ncbi:MAG: UDP-N-acetylmuramate--L-alanine ligase, partial [Bacteroidales bacterium]|nr:UDP-N-acetylmuramate--L-alanine ligase [Bacteroidales bacterium]